MSLWHKVRLLPLLVIVALLVFAVRLGETYSDVRKLSASAEAEDTQPKADEKATEDASSKPVPEAAKDASALPPPDDASMPAVDLAKTGATPKEGWVDPAAQDLEDSPERMALIEDLSARRQQLDAREQALAQREAIIRATEKQVDDKLAELAKLRSEIENLLGKQSEEEQARINSLVKIYESMKAKDAANIFNQMDMDVLLQVIGRMNEKKTAPILAAMDTAKANEVTVKLSEQKKLPSFDDKMEGNVTDGVTGSTMAPAPQPTEAPAGSAALPGLDAIGRTQTP